MKSQKPPRPATVAARKLREEQAQARIMAAHKALPSFASTMLDEALRVCDALEKAADGRTKGDA